MAFRTVNTPLQVTTGIPAIEPTTHSIPVTSLSGSGGGILVIYGINGNPVVTVTPPSSPWVTLFNGNNTADDPMLVLWLPPGASQVDATITTDTGTRSTGYLYRIDGEDSWTPSVAGAAATGNTTAPDPPASGTPSWNSGGATDTTWIAPAVWRNDNTLVASGGYPTDYTQHQVASADITGGAQGVGIAISGRQLNAASTDPGAYTILLARNWITTTIGIKPAVSTGWSGQTPPDALLGMQNLSGTLTSITDDPDSPDGTWLVTG